MISYIKFSRNYYYNVTIYLFKKSKKGIPFLLFAYSVNIPWCDWEPGQTFIVTEFYNLYCITRFYFSFLIYLFFLWFSVPARDPCSVSFFCYDVLLLILRSYIYLCVFPNKCMCVWVLGFPLGIHFHTFRSFLSFFIVLFYIFKNSFNFFIRLFVIFAFFFFYW